MAADLQIVVTLKDKASKALGAIGKKARGLGSAVGKVMRAGVLAGGAAIAGLAVISIKAFADFDDAMTKSLAIMGDVSEAMRKDMSDAAREVAKTTTFSAKEAAEAYFFLASAGLDAKQSIGAMPKVAAFAQAGNFELALATDLLTDAQSALGLTVDDTAKNIENMSRVSDVLIKANTLSNATAQQFSESLTNKAGPALRATNKSIEEGVAVLAVFADQGIKGAEAGTKLGIVLRDLQTKALKNAGEFEALNIAVFDSEGEMRNMADIVGDLEGALGSMSTAQRKATLLQLGFSDKSVSALQALLGSSDALREYQTELEKAGGITDEVASKQLESFSAQLSLLKSAVMDVFITIGSILVPVLLKLAKFLMSDVLPAVEDFIKGFRGGFKHMGDDAEGFIGKGQRMGKAIREFIDDARPVVERFFSMFISGLKTLREVFEPLVRFILDNKAALVVAITAIGVAILLAFGPGAIAIAAIVGFIVLLGLLRENWDEIKAKITEAINAIITKISEVLGLEAIWEAMTEALEFVVEGFGEVKDAVEDAADVLEDKFEDMKAAVSEFWEKWRKVIIPLVATITGLFIPAMARMAAKAIIHLATVGAQWALAAAKATASAIAQAVLAVPMIIAAMARMAVKAVIHAAKVVASWVATGVGAIAAAVVHTAQVGLMVAKWAWMGVQSLLHAAKVALAWIIALGPIAWVTAAVLALAALIILNWDKIARATSWLKDQIVGAFNSVISWLESNWPLILAILGGPLGLAILAVITFKDDIIGAFNAVKDGVLDAFRTIRDTAPQMISAMATGIKGGINAMIGFFERGINNIIRAWNALEFKLPKVDLGPLGSIGGGMIGTPNIPTVSLPRLHKGGEVLRSGLAVVREGERFIAPGGAAAVTVNLTVNTPLNLASRADLERTVDFIEVELRRRRR